MNNLVERNLALQSECANIITEKCDELEHYSPRQCLRIDGIKKEDDETSAEVLNIVKNCFKEAEVDIPNHIIDRAHRVGKPFNKNGIKYQSVIVKCTNFRYRSMFYRNRKKLKNNKRVKNDLTKRRYSLLKSAIDLLNEKELHDVYVFADINCRLKIVDSSNNESTFFNSIDDVQNYLSQS